MFGTLALVSFAIPIQIHSDLSKANEIKISPLDVLDFNQSVEAIKGAVVYLAENMGLDKSQLLTTIQCESSFDNTKIGDHGLAVGIAQFHKETFDRNCKGDYHSSKDQLICMGQMWKKGMMRHWTCWRIYFSN